MSKLDWKRLFGFSLLGRSGDDAAHTDSKIGSKVGTKGSPPAPPAPPPPAPFRP